MPSCTGLGCQMARLFEADLQQLLMPSSRGSSFVPANIRVVKY